MKRTRMQETGSASQSYLSTLRRSAGIILAVISVVLLAALGAAQRAQAQTFVYTMQGTASGTLTQNSSTSSFSNVPYTFSVTVDPATVTSNGGDHYTGWSTVGSVSIDGVAGTFTNAVMVEAFNNGSSSWVSIAQQISSTSYFGFLVGYSGSLATYDLKSAVGPLTLSAPSVNAFPHSIVTSFGSFVLTSVSTMTFSAAPSGGASVESVLHKFKGIDDGGYPQATLVRDSAGNLFGTTEFGGPYACGNFHCGTVFEMVFDSTTNTYSEKVLYDFQGGASDGSDPFAPLVMDSAGNLFGTTEGGGSSPNCNGGCGTVFELAFDSSTHTYNEKVLYYFAGGADGKFPVGGLVMDSVGNLYGTTSEGGPLGNAGTVFELAYDPVAKTYTKKPLYPFSFAIGEGNGPRATLVRDSAGNLYGTTHGGGLSSAGTVFELIFDPKTNSYSKKSLYNFEYGPNDGAYPRGDLARDPVTGNLFGTTERGGSSDEGIAYELAFDSGTNSYTEKVLHSFPAGTSDGITPDGGILRDSAGNLYGTTYGGGTSTNCYGYGCGTAYELAYDSVTGTYTEKVLYSFTSVNNDLNPIGGLVMDPAGNLFGTASGGDFSFTGSVFGIAPVTLSSARLDFGNMPDGATSSPQTVTLTNHGTGKLPFGKASFSGTNAGDFSIGTTDSCSGQTVAANGGCSMDVTFTPSVIGSESATLALNENGIPVTVSLTGTGTTGGLPTASLTPSSLSFAGQLAGNTDPAQTVTLTNTSASNLTLRIDSIGINSNFPETATTCGGSLAQGDSCTISVAFAPAATGNFTGLLTVQDNASTGGGEQTVTLYGTGLSPTQYVQGVMVSQVTGLGVNPGQTNSLTTELQQATTMISAGKINGAIGNLEGFIAHVNGLLNAGVLNSDQASTLITSATDVIAQLQ